MGKPGPRGPLARMCLLVSLLNSSDSLVDLPLGVLQKPDNNMQYSYPEGPGLNSPGLV